jgi:tetratricopeptide (TPR) repeat protein
VIGAAAYALVTFLGARDDGTAVVVAAHDAADAVAPPMVDQPPADPTAAAQAAITELVAQGRLDAALDAIIKARRQFPAAAAFPFAAGKIYFTRLFWDDGIKAFRDAIRLDPALRSDPELIKTVLRGFITTPDVDRPIETFLREDLGAIAIPYLEETAREHPNAMIRARAQNELKRMR